MISSKQVSGGIVCVCAVTAMGLIAGCGMSGSDNYAKVLSVSPVTKKVSVPQENCRDQLVSVKHPTNDPDQIVGTVAGAVIGGLAGSQVGDGNGKKAATVGGAVAGGYAGNQIQEGMQDRNVDQVSERVCETTQTITEQQVGYKVTYLLDGQERTVRMTEDPGTHIRIADGEPVIN